MRTTVYNNILNHEILAKAAYYEKDYVQLSQEPNTFGIKCDENGIIKYGAYKGCTLDSNKYEGNDSFKKMEKVIKTIKNIWLLIYFGAMLWTMYLIRTSTDAMNPKFFFGLFIPLTIAFQIYLAAADAIKKKKILETASEYKAILYDVRGRHSGKSTIKECYFAIWDNGKVRIIKEFIFPQPFNRLSSIKKDKALIGQEFTVIASPDETGYCIRK